MNAFPKQPFYLAFFILFFAPALRAQIGGVSAYEFLNLPNSATVAGLGGHHIALMDDDLSLALRNPGLLNPLMDKRFALSHAFHPAGISNSSLAYGTYLEDLKATFQAGLQYANYGGDLVRRDNTGQNLGTFSANEFAVTVGAARQFEKRLSVGANLKLISSQLAGYNSYAVGADAGIHYVDTSGLFGISLLARNFGRQLTKYDVLSGREPMPFELQIGINKELRYLPFRFSLIYRYLDRWNVLFDDPNTENQSIFLAFGEEENQRGAGSILLDNLARHLVFNGELLIGKSRNLRVRFGYNHGLQRELRLTDFRSGAGYTYGFSWKTKRFAISYGRSTYHLGGGVNQLGLDFGLGKR